MKLFRFGLIMLVGLMPLSSLAAIVEVGFTGEINESYDGIFDDITGTYTTMDGVFYIDTATPVSGVGDYSGAVFGMEIYRDGALLLSQSDFTCNGSCANSVYVSDTQEAGVYVQDFYVGNLDLILQPANAVAFNNNIDVFLLAAQGNVADYFDISDSVGSVQVDGEDYFQLYDLTMTEVSQVPLPAAAWLFLSALGGLGIIKRKRS